MKRLLLLIFAVVGLTLMAETEFYEKTLGLKAYKEHLDDGEFPDLVRYRLGRFNADKPGKPCLVLFLHGANQRGRDNESQLQEAVPDIVKFIRDNSINAVVIAPQCYPDFKWVNVPWGDKSHAIPETASRQLRMVMFVVNRAIKQYDVDPNRIYICGLSMGGYGTWDYLSREPKLFAGALIACGGADLQKAPLLVNIPIKVTHGKLDNIVPPSQSIDIVRAIKKAGGTKIELELVPDCYHPCWGQAFSPAKLKWLFEQHK